MSTLKIPLFDGGSVDVDVIETDTIYLVEITPEIARKILKSSNVDNRKLNPKVVSEYAGIIKRNAWDIQNREPLQIYENGKIKSAQHRLGGVSKANISQAFWVSPNVPLESKISDRGKNRTNSDIMKLMGLDSEEASKDITSVVSLRFALGEGGVGTGRCKLADDQMYEYIKHNSKDLIDACRISRLGTKEGLCRCAPIRLALYSALKCGISDYDLMDFATIVNTGVVSRDRESSPATKIREYRLTHNRSDRASRKEMLFLTCDAIKDFCNYTERKQVYKNPNRNNYFRILVSKESTS